MKAICNTSLLVPCPTALCLSTSAIRAHSWLLLSTAVANVHFSWLFLLFLNQSYTISSLAGVLAWRWLTESNWLQTSWYRHYTVAQTTGTTGEMGLVAKSNLVTTHARMSQQRLSKQSTWISYAYSSFVAILKLTGLSKLGHAGKKAHILESTLWVCWELSLLIWI